MLPTQVVPIILGQGVDTKSDPRQLSAGKLSALSNGMFTPGKEIVKRPGFAAEPSGPTTGIAITTFNNELIQLDGQSLWSLSQGQNQFNNKGGLVLTQLKTTPIVRNTYNQAQADSAINGSYSCFAWINTGASGTGCFYSIIDNSTGQTIVNSASVSAPATIIKTLALSSSFFVLYYNSATSRLVYRAITTANPGNLSAESTIATDINVTTPAFDATVFNSKIYLAYPNNTGSVASVYSLNAGGTLSAQANVSVAQVPNVLNIVGDVSNNAWVGHAHSATSGTAAVFVLNSALSGTVLVDTALDVLAGTPKNISSYVSGTTATYYYELAQGTFSTLTPNFIRTNTMTLGGGTGATSVFNRGAGLASKVFVYNSIPYFWIATNSTLQNSYFLMNSSALICAKLSPDLGGGYQPSAILPEINSPGSGTYQFASLIKDSLTSISGTVFTQTGVQSAQITFPSLAPSKFTLGSNLHVGGGILQMYDGGTIVEHGYNIYPEGLTGSLTYSTSATATGYNKIILSPALSFNGSLASSNLSQWQYSALYEWMDNQGQLHRSAPSVPVTISANGWGAVATLTGGTGTSATFSFTSVPTTVIAGMYANYLAGQGNGIGRPDARAIFINNPIASVSGTVVTFASSYSSGGTAGTITTTPLDVVISSYPMGYLNLSNANFPNGSQATVTLYSNIAVGQTLIPVENGAGLFPAGTYITAISGTSSSTATITFSNSVESPAYETINNFNGVPIFYTFDIAQGTISVPTLKQTAKSNADVALYRTELNQDIFYRVSSPTALTYNDKTIDSVGFSDTTADLLIVGNEQLYTTGAVIENIEVPAAQVATTFKSRAIVVPSENQLSWWYSQQVVPGAPAQFNDSFIQNVDAKIGKILSVGTLDDKIIFFGANNKYYVVGDGPAESGLNNDFSYPQKIAGNSGCSNQASLLETPMGLIYQDATKGIHLLDRSLQEQYIGADVEQYNSQIVTAAHTIPGTKLIRFTLNSGQVLTYDLFYGQWGVDQYASAPNDATIYNNQYTWLSASGTSFSETSGTWTDNGSFIQLNLTTGWINVGSYQGFMRAKKLMILGTYFSPHTLNVNIYTDYNDTTPVQTTAIPVLVAPKVYQYWIELKVQKCEALKLQIFDTQSANFGEGFSLSSLALEIGVKRGVQKLPAGQGY